MNARGVLRLGLLAACVATATSTMAAPLVGDAKNGSTVATACQACHGAQGEGIYAAGFPRLAGQTAVYLEKQLNDYASGSRANPVMAPLAKGLSAQQRADVAAHFAGLSPPSAAPNTTGDANAIARGRVLGRQGDESKQLQACGNCHGPEGRGEAFAAPYLAGQSATYITSVIKEWKSGARKNDAGQLMAVVANRLDDADIAAVATYFESIGPLP